MPATYLDRFSGLTTAVAVKAPCRVATTANLTLSGIQTVDGVALADGDRVLVRAQTSSVDNGIYVVGLGTWLRALDFNGERDCVTGTSVLVIDGLVNGGAYFLVASDDPVPGTSAILFERFLDATTTSTVLWFPCVADMLAADDPSDGRIAYVKEYYAGTGLGGGWFAWDALSTTTADGGLVMGTGVGRWKRRAAVGDGPLLLEWWGLGGTSEQDIAAVTGAMQALYLTECSVLKCDGIPIFPARQILLNNDNLTLGNTPSTRGKFIEGLNIRAVAGTWNSGDAAFYVHGDDDTDLIRSPTFVNCRFDGGMVADYAFKCSGFYHMRVASCVIQDALVAPFYETSLWGGTDGSNNGLIIDDCDIRVPFGQGAGRTGIIVESVDCVIKGGWTSWVEVGIESRGGGIKVEGHHFVSTGLWGFVCKNPRNVLITACDFDSSGILFDDTDAPIAGWRSLMIIGNEHVVSSLQSSIVRFVTGSASNFISSLSIVGNSTQPGTGVSATFVSFATAGSGTWATTWEAVYVRAVGAASITAGNIPARRVITAGDTADLLMDLSTLILRSASANADFYGQNTGNNGSNMPRLRFGGTNGQEALLMNGAGDSVKFSATGNFQPGASGTQDLGASTLRWKTAYLGLGNYANDAAAATGGVGVGGLYHTSGAVKVRLT